MKQRLIKLYSFDRGCISDEHINAEDIESQIVTLADSFLIIAFDDYSHEIDPTLPSF